MSDLSTRDEIIKNADRLFYEQGFEKTSFTDIAREVQISRGNFYHHFKSKDEILSAVIQYRLKKTEKLLETWQLKGKDPQKRIQLFIHILIANLTKIKLYGCPVGTLTTELNKLEHVSRSEANEIFNLFRDWLRQQFVDLGFKKNANKYAMHVLARSQGIATLANAYRDESFVNYEVKVLIDWVKGLNNK
ncbi:TetR/AcrR family transcriptional regulator [Halobacteriovorax sp. XZX-3]|uniref:TetR/AcrR family transcriptional regulator n=1 Tax=unclassified Halobacteriovorax TaxID=2639665 RepID=UPI003713C687